MTDVERRRWVLTSLLVGPAVALLAYLAPGSEALRSVVGWCFGVGPFVWGLVELLDDTEPIDSPKG